MKRRIFAYVIAMVGLSALLTISQRSISADEINKDQTIEISELMDLSGRELIEEMDYQFAYSVEEFDCYEPNGGNAEMDSIWVLPDKLDEAGAFEIRCGSRRFSFMGITVGDSSDSVTTFLEELKVGRYKHNKNSYNYETTFESFENDDCFFQINYADDCVVSFIYIPRAFIGEFGAGDYEVA